MDRDGHHDIVMVVGRSYFPKNTEVNGYSDGESMVVSLDSEGGKLWSRPLADNFGGVDLVVADVNGDTSPEILTLNWKTPTPEASLRIFDSSGKQMAKLDVEMQMIDVEVLAKMGDELPYILVSTSYGTLDIYQLAAPGLVHLQQLKFSGCCTISGVMDLLSSEGPEIFVTEKFGRSVVLSSDFQPLAFFSASPLAWQGNIHLAKVNDGYSEVYRAGMREGTVRFILQPVTTQPGYFVVAGIVVAILVLLTFLVRYIRKEQELNPEIMLEMRLHLLESLVLSNHGAVAPVNTIRRLNFCLRALQADVGDSRKVQIRLDEIISECKVSSLPHLSGLVSRARIAQLDQATVENVAVAVDSVASVVRSLSVRDKNHVPRKQLVDSLEKAEKQVGKSISKLRCQVSMHFRIPVIHFGPFIPQGSGGRSRHSDYESRKCNGCSQRFEKLGFGHASFKHPAS